MFPPDWNVIPPTYCPNANTVPPPLPTIPVLSAATATGESWLPLRKHPHRLDRRDDRLADRLAEQQTVEERASGLADAVRSDDQRGAEDDHRHADERPLGHVARSPRTGLEATACSIPRTEGVELLADDGGVGVVERGSDEPYLLGVDVDEIGGPDIR